MTLNPFFCYLTKWNQNCMVKASFIHRFESYYQKYGPFNFFKINQTHKSCFKLKKPITYHPRAAAWIDEFLDVHDEETSGTRILTITVTILLI